MMMAMRMPAESHLEDIYEEAPAERNREVLYRGLAWTVLRGVFAPYPTFGSNTGITPKNREMYEGKTVLDLGCGSGVRGIIAAMSGAEHVLATDINRTACVNTAMNAERHGMSVSVLQADMFAGIGGTFDTIVSYLPSRDAPIDSPEQIATHDPGLRLNKRLIDEGRDYLKPGGTLHTSFLDQGGIADMKDRIVARGYEIESHKVRPHETTGDWHFFSLRAE